MQSYNWIDRPKQSVMTLLYYILYRCFRVYLGYDLFQLNTSTTCGIQIFPKGICASDLFSWILGPSRKCHTVCLPPEDKCHYSQQFPPSIMSNIKHMKVSLLFLLMLCKTPPAPLPTSLLIACTVFAALCHSQGVKPVASAGTPVGQQ